MVRPTQSVPSSIQPRSASAPAAPAPQSGAAASAPADEVSLAAAPAQNQTPAPASVSAEQTTPAAPPSATRPTALQVPELLTLEEAGQVETPRPALGTSAFWTAQARDEVDFFARVSVDREQGGFFTHLDADGKVTNPDEKFLMPTSRQVHAYSAAYRMTGDLRYLQLARHGVDFILAHHVQQAPEGGVYFTQRVDRSGAPLDQAGSSLVINEQTYGLTGLIGYYKATRDPKVLEVIRQGHEYLTKHFSDPVHGGFFDGVDPATGQAATTKSYNSTVYPATSALLELAEIAEGDFREQVLDQVEELGSLFARHFPDPKTGFIVENFTADWQPDWRSWQRQDLGGQTDPAGRPFLDATGNPLQSGTIGVGGHNTQGALFLLRADRLLREGGRPDEARSQAWTDVAKGLVDGMLERAYDPQHGGWFDVFVRETGQNMWHTNKAFWQQEEGYLATLALARLTGESRYREAADKTLEFWDQKFMDRRPEAGPDGAISLVSYGDRQTVAADGTPLTDPKGGPGKSSYHTTEMAWLGREIGEW